MAEIKVTLHMPDEIYNQVKHEAEQSHRPIDAYLEERLALWLFLSHSQPAASGEGHEALQRAIAVDTATGDWVPIFDPRHQIWREHFAWSEGGELIIGMTATGRATVLVC